MNDTAMRHMVAAIATIICLMAYYSGYVSGIFGWWWTVFGLLVIYGGIYKILDK
jgi:hypothetical protein